MLQISTSVIVIRSLSHLFRVTLNFTWRNKYTLKTQNVLQFTNYFPFNGYVISQQQSRSLLKFITLSNMVDSHGRNTIKQRITGENALHQSMMGNTLSSFNKTKQSFFTTSNNENNFLMSVVPSWGIVTAGKSQYRLHVYSNGYSAPVTRNAVHRIIRIPGWTSNNSTTTSNCLT